MTNGAPYLSWTNTSRRLFGQPGCQAPFCLSARDSKMREAPKLPMQPVRRGRETRRPVRRCSPGAHRRHRHGARLRQVGRCAGVARALRGIGRPRVSHRDDTAAGAGGAHRRRDVAGRGRARRPAVAPSRAGLDAGEPSGWRFRSRGAIGAPAPAPGCARPDRLPLSWRT